MSQQNQSDILHEDILPEVQLGYEPDTRGEIYQILERYYLESESEL